MTGATITIRGIADKFSTDKHPMSYAAARQLPYRHAGFPKPVSCDATTHALHYLLSEIEAWGEAAGYWDSLVGVATRPERWGQRPRILYCECCKASVA